jgi:membrane-associated phospholipid phosphatase
MPRRAAVRCEIIEERRGDIDEEKDEARIRKDRSSPRAVRGPKATTGTVSSSSSTSSASKAPATLDIGRPSVALAALAEFSILAADQASGGRVFPAFVDANVHELVLTTTPLEIREDVFAHLVSDPLPEAALLLLFVSSAVCLTTTSRPGGDDDDDDGVRDDVVRRVGASFATCVGAAPLVESALKPFFHRARPLAGATTFSFPSGHSLGCAVAVGLWLFVMLDPTWRAIRRGRVEGTTRGELEEAPVRREARAVAWFVCVFATASGRIFADRHWLSDTMAGAALGVCIVSCVVGFVDRGGGVRGRERRRGP